MEVTRLAVSCAAAAVASVNATAPASTDVRECCLGSGAPRNLCSIPRPAALPIHSRAIV